MLSLDGPSLDGTNRSDESTRPARQSDARAVAARIFAVLLLATWMIAGAACSSGDSTSDPSGSNDTTDTATAEASESGKKRVVAVNYALAYFAERIASGAVNVDFPVPPNVDPAYWKPSDEEVASIQSADLILMNGAGYAKWAASASLPQSRIVVTSKSFEDRYIHTEGPTHSHGPEGEHAHKGTDFNTWVDPMYARAQAQAVLDGLLRLAPKAQGAMRRNYEALADDLRALDRGFDDLAERTREVPLLASHPVYGYIADRYEWKLESLHWEPDQMPSQEEFDGLTQRLAKHPAKLMIWEDHPDRAIAEKLAADYAMDEVVFLPCGNRPDEGDYVSVMRDNLGRLEAALAK